MQSERPSHAEVVGIEEAIADFDLFSFDADIGDPMLAAAVWASRDVQLQVLVESRQTFFQFLDEPPRKALGLRDGKLAKLGPAAGDSSSREWRAMDGKANRIQLFPEFVGVDGGDVDDQQVLHARGAKLSIGKAFGEIRRRVHLVGGKPSTEDDSSNIGKAGLLLRMNTNVIPVDIVGRVLFRSRIQLKSNSILQLR